MDKNLPKRPNLDHLRRQAKALLAAIQRGDAAAAATLEEHLPAARGKSAAEVRALGVRLADAQSAIARKTGFASWPQLSRHVEQLRALEGSWAFARLEVDGQSLPAAALQTSRLLIDGDQFRTETPAAIYEGVFNINVEADPHEIDIEFVAGPEAGSWNYGIFRLDGDALEICLDVNGRPRPAEFRSAAGSGHAYETLTRSSAARPADVTGGSGGSGAAEQRVACGLAAAEDRAGFEFVASPLLARLGGEWQAVRIVVNGQELPKMMVRTGVRSATGNEIRISVGGQTVIHALVRLEERADPVQVDYYHLDGAAGGSLQRGIMRWAGDEACFCMGPPRGDRPDDFSSQAGSGRTFSQWRRKA